MAEVSRVDPVRRVLLSDQEARREIEAQALIAAPRARYVHGDAARREHLFVGNAFGLAPGKRREVRARQKLHRCAEMLEPRRRVRVARVSVWMPAHGELSILA